MSWLGTFGRRLTALMRRRPGEPRIYIGTRHAGVQINEDTALTFGAVYACVRVISETLAGLPWCVYQLTQTGRQELDNAVARLLNLRPNPEQTAFSLREALMAHVLTWGNGYAEIQRDMLGRAIALWLITPDRVIPDRIDGALVYRVRDADAAGAERVLQAADVLHIHGLGYDGICGYSPVRMAARSIGIGIAQDTFAGAFYANGTHVGGIVQVDANLSPEQLKEVEAYVNDEHRGPEKAFKVKVLGQGMKYEGYTMPLDDAQFLESRKFSVTEVARWYRVPPHKIADLDRSTNNNIEHQGIEFVTDTVVPWAQRLEQEASAKLLIGAARNVQYTKLNIKALMRGDAKSRGEFYGLMTRIGAMTVNEVRALEELDGIGPEGDECLVQLNQTTLERMVKDPPAPGGMDPAAPSAPGDPNAEPAPAGDPAAQPAPSNVIRAEALAWYRGRQA